MVDIQNTQKMWQFPPKYREEKPEWPFILCLLKRVYKTHKQVVLELKDENVTYLSFYKKQPQNICWDSSRFSNLVWCKFFQLHFNLRQQSEQILPPAVMCIQPLNSNPIDLISQMLELLNSKSIPKKCFKILNIRQNGRLGSGKITGAEIMQPTNQNKTMNVLHRSWWTVQMLLKISQSSEAWG